MKQALVSSDTEPVSSEKVGEYHSRKEINLLPVENWFPGQGKPLFRTGQKKNL